MHVKATRAVGRGRERGGAREEREVDGGRMKRKKEVGRAGAPGYRGPERGGKCERGGKAGGGGV